MARLTKLELEAILAAAGDCDAGATYECLSDDVRVQQRMLDALASGTAKLEAMLDRKRARRPCG